MAKPKIAICWLGSCGGCDETVVDINEVLLRVAAAVDIVLWPVAMDFKYDSLKKIKNGGIVLGIVNGHVRNSEQEEIAKILREKSQLILAFGACACFGGTPSSFNTLLPLTVISFRKVSSVPRVVFLGFGIFRLCSARGGAPGFINVAPLGLSWGGAPGFINVAPLGLIIND